jgi:tetratricopeptide (TPR) repeat protein
MEAAVKAIEAQSSETTAAERQLELALQQARYEVAHAHRSVQPSICGFRPAVGPTTTSPSRTSAVAVASRWAALRVMLRSKLLTPPVGLTIRKLPPLRSRHKGPLTQDTRPRPMLFFWRLRQNAGRRSTSWPWIGQTLSHGGPKISLIQSKYVDAAKDFAQAAAVLPLGEEHDRTRLSYLDQEATALQRQSFELEDNAAAISAIARFRRLLELRPRERVPLDWARTQDNLGAALRVLGELENGTARLEEAVEAFQAALMEQTRERVPLDWAGTQTDLGFALRVLGERENGTARLQEAVDAFHAALTEQTREVVPLQWAFAQTGLGLALFSLGERESDTVRLEEAVQAYRVALTERTRERVPLGWARTQSHLGFALTVLGERENGTAGLEEAVEAFQAALMEQTRERAPQQWAATQNNLSAALKLLQERKR